METLSINWPFVCKIHQKGLLCGDFICDAQRMPIRIGSQTKFATVGRGHKPSADAMVDSSMKITYKS